VLVVNDARAFALRYPSVPAGRVAGEFGHSTLLDNAGERVGVGTLFNRAIQDFAYRDGWFDHTDGAGFSLVVRNPLQDRALWDSEDGWRASWQSGGNPAAADPSPLNPGDVVINELLAHSDEGIGDWVELRNMTADKTFNLTGWFLSDASDPLNKYALPTTILGPGAYAVFNELNHFGSAFALSELGDDLYLTSRAPDGTPGGYREDEHFGASDRNVTLGRYVKPSGGKDFIPLSAPTYGAPNTPPRIGPVVINEILYHPLTGDEFIELRNLSAQNVPLHDSQPAPNPWEFSEGIEFAFPAGAYVPANGYALVVKGDPALFRTAHGIPAGVPIYGPYAPFALDNAGETIVLSRPGSPEADGFVPYVIVEKVTYDNMAPWPPEADGLGPSLSRVASWVYGNDVLNWRPSAATGGTPGALNDVGVDPPQVLEVVLNPAGPGQTRTDRTVSGIDPSGLGIGTIQVVFSKAVNFTTTDVTIRKVTFDGTTEVPAPEDLSPLNVSGAGTATMQIEFVPGSAVDTWVRVRLSAAGITAAGTGTPLDGEPRTNSSGMGYLHQAAVDLPTGDGLPGGDAVFYMGSLRGDFTGDGAIADDDVDGFVALWLAADSEADFRGEGFDASSPDGRITPVDIDGFIAAYNAAVAEGRHLDPLPDFGPQREGAPEPVLIAFSPEVPNDAPAPALEPTTPLAPNGRPFAAPVLGDYPTPLPAATGFLVMAPQAASSGASAFLASSDTLAADDPPLLFLTATSTPLAWSTAEEVAPPPGAALSPDGGLEGLLLLPAL
ncbi:MAG: lamin tail domain-containing protein, partial [Planctomycetota bacterium]|nr:lamin tail domain-containing protein [Planctomycetota bacterium]